MKVLSEYPEAKMTSEQQNDFLGETFTELAKRLDEGIPRSLFFLLILDISLIEARVMLAI